MKKTIFLTVGVFALVAFFTVVAFALPSRGKRPFEEIDIDKNGKISEDEWTAFHANMFTRMDKNGDGYLNDDELRPPKPGNEDDNQ